MDSYEMTKQSARGKLKSAFILVLGVGVLCGVGEYRQMMRATDTATIVFLRPQGERVISMPEQAVVEEKPAVAVNVENSGAVVEFLDALREVKNKVDAVERQVPVLEKIRQQPPVVVSKVPEERIFEEGKLEIYDSEKGIVAVENVAVNAGHKAEAAVKEAAAQLAAERQKQEAEADKIAGALTEKAQQVVQRAEEVATESGAVNMLPAGLGHQENKAEERSEPVRAAEVPEEVAAEAAQVPVKRVESALEGLRENQAENRGNAQAQQQQQAAAEREVEKAVLENEAVRPAPVAAGDKAPLLKVVNGEVVVSEDYNRSQRESGIATVQSAEHIENTSKNEEPVQGADGGDAAVDMMKGIIQPAGN